MLVEEVPTEISIASNPTGWICVECLFGLGEQTQIQPNPNLLIALEHFCPYIWEMERVDKFIVQSDITSNKLQHDETVSSMKSPQIPHHTQKIVSNAFDQTETYFG